MERESERQRHNSGEKKRVEGMGGMGESEIRKAVRRTGRENVKEKYRWQTEGKREGHMRETS